MFFCSSCGSPPRVVDKLAPSSHGNELMAAGNALERFNKLLLEHGRKVPDDVCDELNQLCVLHCNLLESAHVHILPKHHFFRHMAQLIRRKGNPRYYNCYVDESMNGTIALVCNTTHRARFERVVFRKFGYMEMKKRGSTGAWPPRPALFPHVVHGLCARMTHARIHS